MRGFRREAKSRLELCALQLVSKDSLDSQLTAKNLMDKDVYDRNGKKIGKVVDDVLADQTGTLSSAFSSATSSRSTGSGSFS